MTLADRIRKEGEKRGLEIGEKRGMLIGEKRGMLIGELKGRVKVARRMLAADQPFEDITKYTRLSPEQVQKLRVQAETQAIPKNL